MPAGRHNVGEYTRRLADGTQVQVHEHTRTSQGVTTSEVGARRTPVQQHRRKTTKKKRQRKRHQRRKKGIAQARRGLRRLQKAYRAAKRKKKATAACLALAGVVELGAWFTFQVVGLIAMTLAMLAVAISGALMLDIEDRR